MGCWRVTSRAVGSRRAVGGPQGGLAVLAALVVAAALVGCSRSDSRGSDSDPHDSAPANDLSSTLRLAKVGELSVDPAFLNPTRTMDVLAADLLFDGLTEIDPNTGSVVAGLAQRWSTSDGSRWTFELDGDRQFHNGDPIDATSVVNSMMRTIRAGSESIDASRLDLIQGAAELATGANAVTPGVEAVAPTTVAITLVEPNYELPAILANPAYAIVSPGGEPDADIALDSSLAGSGDFAVADVSDGRVQLRRVAETDESVDTVEFIEFVDGSSARAAFEAGDVDIAPETAPASAAGEAVDDGATEPSSVFVSAATLVLEVNTRAAPWTDPAARSSLASLIGSEAVAPATADALAGRVTSIVPGAVPSGRSRDDAAGAGTSAPAGSVEALDGSPRTVLTLGEPEPTAAAQGVVTRLTAGGLTAAVSEVDPEEFQQTVIGGLMDLVVFSVTGLSPSPEPYLSAVLGSRGSENLSGFAAPEFDAALAAARSIPDDEARRVALEAVEAAAGAAAAVLPLRQLGERFLVGPAVSGVSPTGGMLLDVDQVRLGR